MIDSRNTKNVIAAFLALFLSTIIMASVFTYAWFSSSWHGEKNPDLSTGGATYPNMSAWVYDLAGETSGETTDKTSGQWRAVASGSDTYVVAKSTVDADLPVGSSGKNNAGLREKLTFTSLHLGTIDNLLSLNSDNYFLLRFDLTDIARHGRRARARFSLIEENIRFFDAEGVEHFRSNGVGIDFSLFSDLIQIECAVSALGFAPSTAEESILSLFNTSNQSGYVSLQNGDEFADVFSGEKDSPYYLFVRIAPDLEGCIAITETITRFMPCQLLLGLVFEIEFYGIYV
ncbi:MAG: hypothetical protein J6X29_02040 [Clostridia bacterium]|nr:hypothetical protein [Clostridia bacterium]